MNGRQPIFILSWPAVKGGIVEFHPEFRKTVMNMYAMYK